MPYTVPTAAEFKARHPRFAALADGTATAYLAEASRSVSTDWAEDDYQDAIMYLAASLMFDEGALAPTKTAPGTAGPIKKLKAGDVETEFSVPDASVYRKRYEEIAKRNGALGSAAVLVV